MSNLTFQKKLLIRPRRHFIAPLFILFFLAQSCGPFSQKGGQTSNLFRLLDHLEEIEFVQSPLPEMTKIRKSVTLNDSSLQLPAEWQELIQDNINTDIRLGAFFHPLVLKFTKPSVATDDLRTKNILFAPQPTTISLERLIKPGTELSFGYATLSPKKYRGAGTVQFEISIRDENTGKESLLFSKSLEPGSSSLDQEWFDDKLDLSDFADRKVKLLFKTSASDSTTGLSNPSVWVNPILLERNTRKKINVILISLDALRADHLGCYGHFRDTSPNIDRLAQEGVLFKNAIAQAPYTLSSHMSMLTSLYPSFHSVNTLEKGYLPSSIPTLAEIFYNDGYRTFAITGGGQFHRQFSFSRGFESFIEGTHAQKEVESKVEEVIAFLEKERNNNFFIFLHTYQIHSPYLPNPPYDTLFDPDYEGSIDGSMNTIRLVNKKKIPCSARDFEHVAALYDGDIRETDIGLSRLWEYLRQSSLDKNTLVVITADHGDEFGEHGEIGHSGHLYDEVLKVPLIFRLPGVLPEGKMISTQVQSIDILPTIMDITGVKWKNPNFQGRSLLPMIKSSKPVKWKEQAFSERLAADGIHWRSFRTPSSKYIFINKRKTGETHHYYYDLIKDPREQKSLKIGSALTQEMFGRIRFLIEGEKKNPAFEGRRQKLDEKTLETLRALGYIR